MKPFPTVLAELANDKHTWWGHTAKHGWVVLDRQDVRNSGDERYLIRCRASCLDWPPGTMR